MAKQVLCPLWVDAATHALLKAEALATGTSLRAATETLVRVGLARRAAVAKQRSKRTAASTT